MGRQNQQRRAEKKRRQRTGGARSGGTRRPSAPGDAAAADAQVSRTFAEAVIQAREVVAGRRGALDAALDRLDAASRSAGPLVVAEMLTAYLLRQVHECWHRGWQPADLIRIVHRRCDRPTTELAALLIDAEAAARAVDEVRVPPVWARQLAALRHDRVRRAAAAGCPSPVAWFGGATAGGARPALRAGFLLMATIDRLPHLPQLVPEPCRWAKATAAGGSRRGADLDPVTLEKVRALLAKAESTTFEAEAMAFTAKAQELMTRHAIDRAVLDHDAGIDDEPEGRRIGIDDPYATERAMLLNVVATANRCRSVLDKYLGFCTVFGFGPDLDAVELLYSSLLVQATTVMAAAGSQRDAAGRSRTRSFRQSFLVGFALRIHERLHRAAEESVEHAAARTMSTALVPLLAEREEQVESLFETTFPHMVQKDTRVTSAAGWYAGRAAADQASVAVGEPLPS